MNESTTPAPGTPDPWGKAYSIKRHGVSITNCDSEPVRTPGCVQSHGALLVLRQGELVILQASENTAAILGKPPGELLGRHVAGVVGDENAAILADLLRRENLEANPLFVFALENPRGEEPLNVTVHTSDGLVIAEFEPGPSGNEKTSNLMGRIKQAIVRLQLASTFADFCRVTTEEVRDLTGFDRVMVYKFHPDLHGEVVAESRKSGLESWLGLHYPPEDIPLPAREIFKKIWIRPLQDVSGGLAELVPLLNPDRDAPLDMTFCAIRGASVMYTEYLANMGVTAALMMPIRRGEDLLGFIACHHYSGPRQISPEARTSCEFLAQAISLMHEASVRLENQDYRLRLEKVHHRLVTRAVTVGELPCLTQGDETLLDGIESGGVAVCVRGGWSTAGETPDREFLDEFVDWLERDQCACEWSKNTMFSTDSLGSSFTGSAARPACAAGALAVRFLPSERNWLIWFRPEVTRSISWAGDPAEKPVINGPHGPRLTPRRSFELFVESVRGKATPWLPVEEEAALHLRSLVKDMIIEQGEKLATLNNELRRSNQELDDFAYVASHDLKEPLRGINKYAHLLMNDVSTEESKTRLAGLIKLTLRMDSLLDSLLQLSRVVQRDEIAEVCDLNELVAESIEMVDQRRGGSAPEFVIPRPLPRVRCCRIRVREVLYNLISNALKYNTSAVRRVEIGHIEPSESGRRGQIPPGAINQRVYFVRDNGIGIEPRHNEQEFKLFKRLHGREEFGGGSGIGLAIVKKIVEKQGGEIWLESAPGQGTTFYFTLPEMSGTEK